MNMDNACKVLENKNEYKDNDLNKPEDMYFKKHFYLHNAIDNIVFMS